MIALGMPITYDKKGVLKVLKPDVLHNSVGDFITEIALTQLNQLKDARPYLREDKVWFIILRYYPRFF